MTSPEAKEAETMFLTTHAVLLLALGNPTTADTTHPNHAPRNPRPWVAQPDQKSLPEPVVGADAPPCALPTGAAVDPVNARGAQAMGRRVSALPEIDRLYFASEADGATWVRGRSYKARFGEGGVTYVPFFGSNAPRNFPIHMSLASATVGEDEIALQPAMSAVRAGDRVVIDRGPIDEVYELTLDAVEQTFVLSERPSSGDLKLVVQLDSEMSRAETADGFTFSNEFGTVHYGRAFVRESDGTRVPVASRLAPGGVEIVVEESLLARARYPLVIDPVVTTWVLDGFTIDQMEPDVAFDVTTNRYLVVYEEFYSGSDSDVRAQMWDGAGNLVGADYPDISGESWRLPQCANLNRNDQFLCVAQATNVPGSAGSVIRGVTIAAATFAQSAKFNVSTPEQSGDKLYCDVGGDPNDGPGASYYCVVWQRNFTSMDQDVHARLVAANATLVGPGTILIDNSGSSIDWFPAISKSNGTQGAAAAWTIAWHRSGLSNSYRIHAARLGWDGALLDGSTATPTNGPVNYFARVSSPLDNGRVLIVFASYAGSAHSLNFHFLNGVTTTFGGQLDFDAAGNQFEHSVDSDGTRFAIAFTESVGFGGSDWDAHVMTFAADGNYIWPTEARQMLDAGPALTARTDIVARRSGGDLGSRRFFAVWDRTASGGQRDIVGGIYDRPRGGNYTSTCWGGGSVDCPCFAGGAPGFGCANSQYPAGAALSITGASEPGAGDTTVFTAVDMPGNAVATLFQGTLIGTVVAFGDGLRCVTGSVIRIRTKTASAAGVASWPGAGEPPVSVTGLVPVSNARRNYQVMYRNSANFCTSATVNITNGMHVFWLL